MERVSSGLGLRVHATWVLWPPPLESRVGIHAAVGGQEEFWMAHMVKCVKMGREMEGLDEPPFDGELGQRIYNNVSKLAWEQWQEHMKMLLNEYRLQPWKKEHQEFIVQQMDAYFFGEGAEKPKDFVPPSQ
jgi:Fe-S cluster biosynthesis and repair protein YggX